ncbi:MAG TPA: DUF1552 domain-containing protein [Planctomycetota bacterium]
MSSKSWHLDRRTFLRGMGVAVAAPWLQGMERALPAPDGETARRLAFVYFPNGCSLPNADDEKDGHWRWYPRKPGADYEFTKVLESLEPFRAKLSLLGGLSHPLSRELLGHLAGDTWLTAGDMRFDQYKNRISVDQLAARTLKKYTRYPSLVLSADGGVGYKSRVSTLSFDANGRPIPSEHVHRRIFERYFAPDHGATAAERRRSLQEDQKVVDLVLQDGKDLRGRLGTGDQQKLDEYLESLNAVEEQVRRTERWLDVPLGDFDASHIDLDVNQMVDPQACVRTMYDLMVLGFQLDLTRVMTYMLGREDGMGFGDNYPKLACGINRSHHTISHDTHEGHWTEWGTFDRWFAKQFAYFIDRLNTVEDANGPLLDSTMVLYGGCCSTTHNARNYPLALVGGGQMGLQHGRYTVYDESTPFCNLFVSMLQTLGIEAESFGDSTGPLAGGPFV